MDYLLSSKSNRKELLVKLNQIIDRFLEKYSDFDNEIVRIQRQEIDWNLNIPRSYQDFFMVLQYFLISIPKPLLIVQNLKITYWDLADMCRNVYNSSIVDDVVCKMAQNLSNLINLDLKLLDSIIQFLLISQEELVYRKDNEKDFIQKSAMFLTPYLFTGKHQLYKIERHFYPLTIVLIYYWNEIKAQLKDVSKPLVSNTIVTVFDFRNNIEKFYNPLAGKMVKNSSTQTAHALVEPVEYYQISNSVSYQKALNDLENKFQDLESQKFVKGDKGAINKQFYEFVKMQSDELFLNKWLPNVGQNIFVNNFLLYKYF